MYTHPRLYDDARFEIRSGINFHVPLSLISLILAKLGLGEVALAFFIPAFLLRPVLSAGSVVSQGTQHQHKSLQLSLQALHK